MLPSSIGLWRCYKIDFTKYFFLDVLKMQSCGFLMVSGKWKLINSFNSFNPDAPFLSPWKCQEIVGFLTFSGGIRMWQWAKMDKIRLILEVKLCNYPLVSYSLLLEWAQIWIYGTKYPIMDQVKFVEESL